MHTLLSRFFSRVTYACTHCEARQRIPLRRVHVFERFHHLQDGQVVLIDCPHCAEGVQIPSPYLSHTGQHVYFDPDHPDNVVLHAG